MCDYLYDLTPEERDPGFTPSNSPRGYRTRGQTRRDTRDTAEAPILDLLEVKRPPNPKDTQSSRGVRRVKDTILEIL